MQRSRRAVLPASLGQVIIAGSGEDISPADMLEWIAPVLCGIAQGQWLTCEISRAGRGALTTRLRSGAMAPHLSLCRTVPRRRARAIGRLLPKPGTAAVVMLNENAAQVMTLLDGMALWLNAFEADDPAIGPIIRMLTELGSAPATAPRRAALP